MNTPFNAADLVSAITGPQRLTLHDLNDACCMLGLLIDDVIKAPDLLLSTELDPEAFALIWPTRNPSPEAVTERLTWIHGQLLEEIALAKRRTRPSWNASEEWGCSDGTTGPLLLPVLGSYAYSEYERMMYEHRVSTVLSYLRLRAAKP